MADKKEASVYLDTGVSVMLPIDMDPESEEAQDLYRAAFRDLILSQDNVDYNLDGVEEE